MSSASFDWLVKYIKDSGCKVIKHNRSRLKQADCMGTFDISKKKNPIISIAINGHPQQELIQVLLHEYAHFLQWNSGYLQKLEGEDLSGGWEIISDWLAGVDINYDILCKARDAVLLIEYDAEKMVIKLSEEYNLNIGGSNAYMSAAYSYITFLKYAIETRDWKSGAHTLLKCNKILTKRELLRPLSNMERSLIR